LLAGSGWILIALASSQQRNCPKHIEFYSKNKSEKLVNLIGFIIRTKRKVILSEILNAQYAKDYNKILMAQLAKTLILPVT
jgi:hypothetical protein